MSVQGKEGHPLRAHDLLPMFTVTDAISGRTFEYREAWQRKPIVLVLTSPDDPTAQAYVESLSTRTAAIAGHEAILVVTADPVPGLAAPAVLVADRWGEVYHVAAAARAADLSPAGEILDWLQYIRKECPECWGETR